MNLSDSKYEAIIQLADEYLTRLRHGERPSVSEYVDRFPELAAGIRDIFPISALMEDLGSDVRQHCENGLNGFDKYLHASAAVTRPPARLGNYRILGEIGRGGMGIVYEAEDTRLERRVALKVLHAGGRLAPGHSERFEREARAAATLHHTNIVPVFDVGEHEGTTFYAMQFIRGRGLDTVLDELRRIYRIDSESSVSATGRAPGSSIVRLLERANDAPLAQSSNQYWRSVARIGIQVADALQYAHSRGTLHRDIKPSNLMLDEHGVVWIGDFGLAQLEGEAALTQTGEFVGTLRYMAPERFDGLCDPRSDIYSLGLTLYELITLRPAFNASSRHRLIQQVTQDEPPRPRKLNRSIPRDLDTIVSKATAREPDRRYQTARELQADLMRFVEDRPITARRSSVCQRAVKWARRRPLVAGLLAAVALSTLLGIAGVGWQWREAESARDAALQLAANERSALKAKTQALNDKARALEEADRGQRQARHQLARLYEANGLRLLDSGDWHLGALWLSEALAIDEQLASDESAEHRHRIDLRRRRLAHVWRGSPTLVQLKSFPSYRCHYLTDDGALCITDDGFRCFVWDVASGEQLYPALDAQLAWPNPVSPDGQHLLVFNQQGVRVHELQTGRLLKRYEQHIPLLVSWACNGERIVALSLAAVLRIWDTATGQLVTAERDLGTPPAIQRSLYGFAVSRDGEHMSVAVGGRSVPVFNLRTGELVSEVIMPDRAMGVALSPDGTQLATQSRVLQIWDVGSAQETARLDFPVHNVLGHLATFSPDGTRIAFGDEDGIVRVRDLANKQDVFPPLHHRAAIQSVAFSPDGTLLVTAAHDATVRLWDASTGLPVGPALHHDESAVASFSADGRRIISATRSGTMRIWEVPSIQRPTTLAGHAGPVTIARFSRDGRRLITGSWDQTVRIWDVASGEQALPPLETSDRVSSISLSADGHLLLTRSADGQAQLWDAQTGTRAHYFDQRAGEQGTPVAFSDILRAQIGPAGRWVLLARDRRYGVFERNGALDDAQFVRLGSIWDRARGGAFDAAGRRALVYSGFGSVHVVDSSTGQMLLKRPPKQKTRHPGVVWAGFGADDDDVLVLRTDGTVERWRISTARRFAEFEVKVEPERAAVNCAGDRLVIAGRDRSIRVWNVVTGAPQTPPARHGGQILHTAFSPDGESFVTASADGTARVWDTATGQPLTPFLRHAGKVTWAEFHPDARQIATAGEDGMVHLWPLAPPDERPVSELLQMARLYSARRIESGAGTIPMTGAELEQLFQELRAENALP